MWPRLTWPAQPVSTTSEAATMPKMTMMVARLIRLVESHIGRVSTKAPMAAHSPARPHHLGQRAHLAGDRADLPVASQVDEASLSTRLARCRRTSSSPTSTIRKRTASLYAGRLPAWKVIDWSTMPRPMAAAPIVVKRSNRPNTAAASAWTRNVGGQHLADGQAHRPGAQEHGQEGEHRGHHPHHRVQALDRDAEGEGGSARSAAPTMATPMVERCRNRPAPPGRPAPRSW